MKVMVFGVFDRLHPGHLYFLYHARLLGGELITVIARDSAVKRLKGHLPKDSARVRAQNVRATKLATKVVLGDTREGSYAVIKQYKPDIIALGYDQRAFGAHLREYMRAGRIPQTKTVNIGSYKPKKYHSALLA